MSDLSDTTTNQRNDPTCAYHVAAKLVVQNIFHYLTPSEEVDVKTFEQNQCNQFLDGAVYGDDQLMQKLTPATCSPGGYDKILQFLYVYYLIREESNEPVAVAKNMFVSLNQVLSAIWKKNIPKFFDTLPEQKRRVHEMLHEVSIAREKFGINFCVQGVSSTSQMSHHCFDIIKKSLVKGFYVGLALSRSQFSPVKSAEHERHAVHVVSIFQDSLIVKNSWGDHMVYDIKIDGYLWLFGYDAFECKTICFLLPTTARVPNQKCPPNKAVSAHQVDEVLAEKTPPSSRPSQGKFLRINPALHRGDVVRLSDNSIGFFMSRHQQNAIVLLFGATNFDDHVKENISNLTRIIDPTLEPHAFATLNYIVERDREKLTQVATKLDTLRSDIEKTTQLCDNLESTVQSARIELMHYLEKARSTDPKSTIERALNERADQFAAYAKKKEDYQEARLKDKFESYHKDFVRYKTKKQGLMLAKERLIFDFNKLEENLKMSTAVEEALQLKTSKKKSPTRKSPTKDDGIEDGRSA